MKKLFVMLFAFTLVILSLCACESEKAFVFTNDYLKVVDGDKEIVVTANTHLEIADGSVFVRGFGEDEVATTEGNYKIADVGVGDTYQAFVDAFCLKSNGAMWETVLYVNERENVYNYPAYDKKAIEFGAYDDVFLTVGFYTDAQGKWNTFDASTLKNAWNLEMDEMQRANVVDFCIISAGLDENGTIDALFFDYGAYSAFEELENYEVNVDFFPQETVVELPSQDEQQEPEQVSGEAVTEAVTGETATGEAVTGETVTGEAVTGETVTQQTAEQQQTPNVIVEQEVITEQPNEAVVQTEQTQPEEQITAEE